MKLSVALFFAGLFGALAAVFILLSFGTDYWLLASESCHPNPSRPVDLGVTIKVRVTMSVEWFQFEILSPLSIVLTTRKNVLKSNRCYNTFLSMLHILSVF